MRQKALTLKDREVLRAFAKAHKAVRASIRKKKCTCYQGAYDNGPCGTHDFVNRAELVGYIPHGVE